MKLQDALRIGFEFHDMFEGTWEQWHTAGSVRRMRPEVKDIEHVVEPTWGTVLGNDMFRTPKTVNLLFHRLDELLLDGKVEKAIYIDKNNRETFRWGEKYRGVWYGGIKHEIFTAHENTFGAILAIRTGPADLSKRLVTMIKPRGYLMKDGQVFPVGRDKPAECKTEKRFFEMAGIKMLKPEERK